ncbi:MAG: type II toxin-antitoxin system MqsA family antitoxin [Deltaproteobacteria bacterium]|nr:type II toxin-antitoxin system MqsA family antitoxin [Deltaproteobacteria bacterium]
MTCGICGETTTDGHVTVTLERGRTVAVFRGVPAQVCPQCGEEWVDGEDAKRLDAALAKLVEAGVQVDVRDYAAAA